LPELVSDRRELTRIGAIFLAPKSITDADVQAIGQLKKITSASRISLICTSKKAEEIGKLRNFCDYYLPEKTDWRKLLDQLALTRLMRLASSLNVDKAKAYLKNGDVKRARKILKETIKIAPLKVEALLLLGECDYLVDDFENAREKYQEALNLNPCLPKPYARLLEIEKGTAREEVLKNAIDYCPGVSEFRV
jgi:tetratricopeptide (TPR) repeat protein